jgi:6,7-dimethyl-8-ribityllumazine synthase
MKDGQYYCETHMKKNMKINSWVLRNKTNSPATIKKMSKDTLIDCGVNTQDIEMIEVPGSFELIYGTKILAKKNLDAIICLGSVIQGKTKHFDYVCQAVSNGIKDLNISLDIPIIFGVLTDNTMEQAISRSGGNHGNKGIEAAITAIKMADLNR